MPLLLFLCWLDFVMYHISGRSTHDIRCSSSFSSSILSPSISSSGSSSHPPMSLFVLVMSLLGCGLVLLSHNLVLWDVNFRDSSFSLSSKNSPKRYREVKTYIQVLTPHISKIFFYYYYKERQAKCTRHSISDNNQCLMLNKLKVQDPGLIPLHHFIHKYERARGWVLLHSHAIEGQGSRLPVVAPPPPYGGLLSCK